MLATTVALLSGAGIFLAILAYIVGGMIGFVAGLVWVNTPQQERSEKHAAAQRS
jgi:Na+-transporting methylmalonyl-CoA/oxaloacetate decarboxylase gamma subunit